ncbi:MAG: isochorismatase family protein [Lachnospiraceae bacterium]|nr:isochorismatase family protein [Lachnospiraceae bacterium]
MRIIREEAAAVVIDYQEKLVPAMHKKEELIRNSQILLKGLKILGVPMCVTQQYTKGLGMTVSEIQEAAGTKAYMDKISFSTADVIAEQVQGKKYVILCGIEAHICVLQTLIDLKAKGYVPVLVEDCISSRKKNDKKMAIKRAIQEGAIVTTYEAVLFELLKEAGTEESKAIQRLIK